MREDKIRDSKYVIPDVNDNLKDIIFEEYQTKNKAKANNNLSYKRKNLVMPTLITLLLALTLALSVAFIPAFNKNYSSGYTEDLSDITPIGDKGEYYIPGSKDGDGKGYSVSDSAKTPSKGDERALDSSFSPSESMASESGDLDTIISGVETGPYENNANYVKTLTSSCVDDNEEFDYWVKLNTYMDDQTDGSFKEFYNSFSFKTLNRIKITLPKNISAKASIMNGDNAFFTAVPNKNGVCYLFSKERSNEYKIKIKYYTSATETKVIEDVISGDKDYTDIITDGYNNHKDLIELMVVIDTTGSMGDEIRYLQKELVNVINEVKDSNPNTEIKVSVIAYKDYEDEQSTYLSSAFDFSSDLTKVNNFLATLSAAGGGDFPEAVEEAFKLSLNSSWSNEDSTKLLLFVADAPSHDKDVASWSTSIEKLASMGVRIINVASSGISSKTEFFFRSQAILTGGVYGFLTDDSGVGSAHLIASTEDTKPVEYLNDMLVRLINGYHTGILTEPVAYNANEQ